MLGLKLKLFVDDLARSEAFYTEALGFETIDRREVPLGDTVLKHVILRNGSVFLSLGLRDRLPVGHHLMRAPDDQVGLGVEICLYVPAADLDAAFARAAALAPGRIDRLAMRPWGARDFRLADPDGYYIRVGEPDGEVIA